MDAALPINAVTGGRGGGGGFGQYGGGGAGGYGAVVTGGGNLGTLSVGVTGGVGRLGGFGFTTSGAGGQGGHGLVLTAASTLTIGAAVSGGTGGIIFGGSAPGSGGYGIVGGGLDLTLNAAVSGGLDGDFATRGFSLYFTGGANNLTLGSGWSLAGGIFINGGSLTLSPSADLTLANDISGSGSFAHTGIGTLILTGTNGYIGGTTISAGTLQIGAGGTTGSVGTGGIVNDGALVFNRSDDFTASNAISGSGSLTKLGAGTLSLTGSNSYTGTTSILAGTLAVNATGLGSTQLVEIGNGATLRAATGFGMGALSILDGGGTIDTNGIGRVVSIFDDIDYGAQLTVTGGGTLFISDVVGTGTGGINLLSGTLTLAGDLSAGDGTIMLANGTTLQNGAFCFCGGSLILANNIEVEDGGTATIDGFGGFTALDGMLSGGNIRFVNSSQSFEGPGAAALFELTGANSYGDTFIGRNVQLALTGEGTLGAGNVEFDSTPSTSPGTPALIFANDVDYGFEGTISGGGFVIVDTNPFAPNPVTISLYGSNTTGNNFTGSVIVSSGRLNIEGDFGDIDNLTAQLFIDACSCAPEDAVFGGSGTFYGNVTFGNATLAPGSSPGTLNIAGNLTLGAGTILNFELGRSGAVGGTFNDLVTVGGNLTLDGTLNTISAGTGYGPGYYQLFRYGTLTDNGLTIGSIANDQLGNPLTATLLFNIAGQINLRLGDQVFQYWDGADTTGTIGAVVGPDGGNGGAGTWNASNTNWTAATGFNVNDSWRSTVGVFAGAAGGTVTVDGAQSFQELRFQTDGYLLRPAGGGGSLVTTGGFSVIDVGAGLTADIGVSITGAAGVTKTGTGTLLLSTGNTYFGPTSIGAGTLRLGSGGALSISTSVDVASGATFDVNGFDVLVGSLAGAGAVTLGAGGQLQFGFNNSSTSFSGTISGDGEIRKGGGGIFTLTGNIALATTGSNFFAIDAGTVQIGAAGSITADSVENFATLTNAGTITTTIVQNFSNFTNNGTVNGSTQNFDTFVNTGTIGELSNVDGIATNSGTINGDVSNFTSFTSTGIVNGGLSNFGTALLQGQFNGGIRNVVGGATITLTNTLTGVTLYQGADGSTFDLANFDTAIGELRGNGNVLLGSAVLTVGGANTTTGFDGVISGSGGLTKVGTGTLTLNGANTYAGTTNINAGTLTLSSTGRIAGNVVNLATFNNDGRVELVVSNIGTGTNNGTIAGGVINNGNFNSGGTIGVGVTNNAGATMFASGAINGFVTNSGTFSTGPLTGITSFSQTATGILNLSTASLAVGSLDGSGQVNLAANILTVGGSNDNTTFAGVINGLGRLTKVGTGQLILSGANTYTGLTRIDAGTLNVTGSLAGRVQNNAALLNSGTIAGEVFNDTGGTATNTGTMSGGLLNFANFQSTGIVSGGVINFGTASFRGQLNGGVENQAGIVTMTGATTGIGRVNQLAGALFDLAGFNTAFGSLAGQGEVRLGGATLTVGSDNTNTTFSGIITGSSFLGGLTKVGTGTLTLSGVNTYASVTNVIAGTLVLTSSGVIAGNVQNQATFDNAGSVGGALITFGSSTSSNSGTIARGVSNGGTFTSTGTIGTALINDAGTVFARGQLNGFVVNRSSINLTGTLTGITTFFQFPTGQLNLGGFNLTLGSLEGEGGVNLGSATLTTGGNNASTTFAGVIAGSGGLTKLGTGTLILAGANTFTGLTTVSAGTLGVSTSGSLASPVVNNATLLNDGTLGGLVTNNATFASTGTLNGGLTNNGTTSIRGQLNGPVNNQSGSITLTGTLTGLAAFNQAAAATFNLANFNATIGSLAGTGSVQLGTAALTLGGNNASTTFAGVISGAGASLLTKVGTGTLTLSGANTYTGITRVNEGTLTVAATGSLASGAVNLANLINAGSILAVDNRAGGSFTNSGTVTNGVVNAGTMSSTGIINVGMNNSGAAQLRGQLNGFVNNTAGTITLTGALTGITAFTQAAGATLNLNGFSLAVGSLAGAGSITFGGTAMTAGDLAPAAATTAQLAAAETPAPAEAPVAAGRIVVTDIAAPAETAPSHATGAAGRAGGFGLVATESATAAPAGMEAVESPMFRLTSGVLGGNAGTARIADTAGSPVVSITGGRGDVVQIAEDAASPAAANPVVLTAGAATLTPQALPPATGPVLTVGGNNASTTFAGVISGNGRLAKVGTGTLILTGNNTYADGTLISGGVLQLGNGGTSGSIVGRIEVNGVLIVNRSDALTLSGIIDGAGLFVQAGTGTTTLTGANAYTNGTLISAGRLRGDSLSLQGLIQNDATLEFAQTTTGTFAGRMAGAGLVEKTGAGLLTYTGNNTFLTGQTRILGGELRVNNLLNRSSVTVGNGSTLSGTSVVGGIVAQSGGTVAPGAGGFGTLGVNGNIQFLAGSAFAAQVQPAGSDLLLGNGTAQLAGTIAVAGTAGVYRFNSVYVLLQADLGRTGTFGTETGLNTFGQAYAPRIVYTPTQVQLLLAPAQLLGIAGPDGTPNQRSTLTRIDAAVAAGYDPQPLIALYNLTPRTAFLNGADQLSGEIYATSVRAALDDDRLVREATLSRLRLTQDMGFGESFGAWGHAVGAWGSGDTDGNAARYERDQQGFVVGMDGGGTMDGGAWRVGLLGHHLTTDINVDARGSNADIERTGGGVYGGLDLGDLRIRAGGTYSSLELSGRRVAAFTGFAETLSGETDGEALQGFAEIAYRFQVGASTHLETYFLASHTRVEFDGFSETGGASRVRVAAEEDDLTTLIFGLRGGTVIPIGASTSLRLDGGLGVRHLSGDRMIFSLISLDASPNQAFDIRSAAADRFALTGNLDATFEFGRTITLSIGYSGVVAANARDHAARATLGLRF